MTGLSLVQPMSALSGKNAAAVAAELRATNSPANMVFPAPLSRLLKTGFKSFRQMKEAGTVTPPYLCSTLAMARSLKCCLSGDGMLCTWMVQVGSSRWNAASSTSTTLKEPPHCSTMLRMQRYM